jgi:hypothetical protein
VARRVPPPAKPPHIIEAQIRHLLEQPLDDATLRSRLEALAAEPSFSGFSGWRPRRVRGEGRGPLRHHQRRFHGLAFLLGLSG